MKSKRVINEVIKCCNENYLYEWLKLLPCGVENCSNMVYHMCQNTIGHTKFHGGFEENFGLTFRCLVCVSKSMMPEYVTVNISKPLNKVSDIIEIEDEENAQDNNLNSLFDDTDNSDSDTDDDVDNNDNDDSSDNDTDDDDDELDIVDFDNEGREINENLTLKSNKANKNKNV